MGDPADESADLAALPAREALPRLFEKWAEPIYRLGLAHCGGPEDAEDVVQETFLQAFRKWEQFEGRSRPSTWLYTIASRACHRKRRRRAGEPHRVESLTELLPRGEPTIAAVPDSEDTPFDVRLRAELFEALDSGLAALPPHFRLPLVLKEIAELPIAEVAEILGLKEATVKTRVHRGRLLLRRALGERLPRRPAPPPDHPQRVCLDLLESKQQALDHGVGSPALERELCSRCQALFETLDLTVDLCQELGRGALPADLKRRIERRLDRRPTARQGTAGAKR